MVALLPFCNICGVLITCVGFSKRLWNDSAESFNFVRVFEQTNRLLSQRKETLTWRSLS
jgi:hypothetical protein